MPRTCRLEPLDNIVVKTGVENIMNSDMHFIAFLRRTDLPVEPGMVPAPGGPCETSAPGDVMALVKQYISDKHVSQPPFVFLRAGASMLMPDVSGPPRWAPRYAFTKDDDKNFKNLSWKVEKLMQAKMPALQYLRDWRDKPRRPEDAPSMLLIFNHTCVTIGLSWHTAFDQAVCRPVDDFKLMSVKRRQSNRP